MPRAVRFGKKHPMVSPDIFQVVIPKFRRGIRLPAMVRMHIETGWIVDLQP